MVHFRFGERYIILPCPECSDMGLLACNACLKKTIFPEAGAGVEAEIAEFAESGARAELQLFLRRSPGLKALRERLGQLQKLAASIGDEPRQVR